MAIYLIEDKTPQRCCGRCGVSWSDYLKDKEIPCTAYGHYYGKKQHIWVWWDPNDKT